MIIRISIIDSGGVLLITCCNLKWYLVGLVTLKSQIVLLFSESEYLFLSTRKQPVNVMLLILSLSILKQTCILLALPLVET